MALAGLGCTYLICVSRGQSDAPLAQTQALFTVYWALFEGFDLLRIKRRVTAGTLDLIFPLNAIGFLGLSYAAWAQKDPGELWMMAACGAVLYVVSAVARAWVLPYTEFAEGDDLLARLRAGSYEGAILLAAVLTGLAIFRACAGRVDGGGAGDRGGDRVSGRGAVSVAFFARVGHGGVRVLSGAGVCERFADGAGGARRDACLDAHPAVSLVPVLFESGVAATE